MCRRVTVVGYVCVCVSSSIFPNSNESAKKTYGSPQLCGRLIYDMGFFIRRYRIQVAAVLVHQSAILLALAGACAYIHSHDIALNHVVFLLQTLPLCLARLYVAHVHIFITGRRPQPHAIIRLKEGILKLL